MCFVQIEFSTTGSMGRSTQPDIIYINSKLRIQSFDFTFHYRLKVNFDFR
nr:MAG TPA: hypothetical protein [Caudoviricetes sp.]